MEHRGIKIQYVRGESTRCGRTSPANKLPSRPIGLGEYCPHPRRGPDLAILLSLGRGYKSGTPAGVTGAGSEPGLV